MTVYFSEALIYVKDAELVNYILVIHNYYTHVMALLLLAFSFGQLCP